MYHGPQLFHTLNLFVPERLLGLYINLLYILQLYQSFRFITSIYCIMTIDDNPNLHPAD